MSNLRLLQLGPGRPPSHTERMLRVLMAFFFLARKFFGNSSRQSFQEFCQGLFGRATAEVLGMVGQKDSGVDWRKSLAMVTLNA